jgi:hypothetical protein
MKVAEKNMAEGQAYEARGVVAKYHVMGHFQSGPMMKVPVYRFVTLYAGEGREAIPCEFKCPAPVIEDNGENVLNVEALDIGDIVVHPGLVYRRCLWFDNLMAAHMRAVAHYKPKVITVADSKPDVTYSQTFDFTTDQVTKQ